MPQHEMRLNAAPFLQIKTGRKRIELRLHDEKRQNIKVGDEILLINREGGEQLRTKVIGLCWFADFASLVSVAGWKECGWDKEYDSEKYDKDMERYYPKQEIEKYGALGMVLELV